MKIRDILLAFITIMVTTVIVAICAKNTDFKANELYQIYLNGNKIGVVDSEDELYALINKKQQKIKSKYQVSSVFPPNNFSIEKLYTYDEDVTDINEVYNKIEEADDFTIEGYVIRIKPEDGEEIRINVLDKEVFEKAINSFILAFVDEDDYNDYLNGTQDKIVDVGKSIENMYFNEKITIKKDHISVNEKIYTDDVELSQHLLFGDEASQKSYTVKEGDTISSISEANKLNPQEFLIANPKFKSVDSLLALNDTVNITLIQPLLTLTYQLYSVEDVEQYFEKTTVYDKSKPASYSEITQPGINGITRVTSRYAVINGEQSQGIIKISEEVLREKVNQVTTKGKRTYNYGSPVNINGDWGWPTNSGYIITSPYGWRWGKFHEGLDIALGYGSGSPIYAVADGVVHEVPTQKTGGKMIIINHGNNIYTMYAHLSAQLVSQGQNVKRGEVIGRMGQTGFATGPHLHFSVSIGAPYSPGYKFISPLSLYK